MVTYHDVDEELSLFATNGWLRQDAVLHEKGEYNIL